MRMLYYHRFTAAVLACLMCLFVASAPVAAQTGLQTIRTDVTSTDSKGRVEAKTEHQCDSKGREYQTQTTIERDGNGKVRKTTVHTYKVAKGPNGKPKLQPVRTVRTYANHKVGKLTVGQYRVTTKYDDMGRALVETKEYSQGGKVVFAERRTTEYIPGTGRHKPVKKEYRTGGKWMDGSNDVARAKARDVAIQKATKPDLEKGPFSQTDVPGVSDEGQHLLVPGQPVLSEGHLDASVPCEGSL